MYTLTGSLKSKKEAETISERFTKREFVVEETTGHYPNPIPLQLTNDRCRQLDNLNVGDEVDVKFFLRGNEAKADPEKNLQEDKTFVNLEAFTVSKAK
jgi:hypothetical protein